MLVEAVQAGNQDSLTPSGLLLERHPDIALETLIRGTQAATNSWVRTHLIEKISEFGKGSNLDFLKGEMLNGPNLESRVAAAVGLGALIPCVHSLV